ncbi:helix-turn-helix domain-containing protein [Acidithiobacillus thiooxidans]|uniref:helix-turn-helix domain-containing protein n=1 Tax=Acidithiobacillus thiooxidans TaxID=930 RepID=UPI001D02192D
MKTLTREEAAELLHIHKDTVAQLAASGSLPGAKAGRRWVFIEMDLIEWLRGRYAANSMGGKECLFSKETGSGGLIFDTADAELDALLERPISKPRKSTTTRSKPSCGARSVSVNVLPLHGRKR